MKKNSRTNNKEILRRIAEISTMPKRAAASVLYREFPDAFSSVEAARSFIRYLTGNSGCSNYERAKNSGKIIHDAFGKMIPEPVECPEDPFQIPTGINKLLILNDTHIPYHDQEALNAAIEYGIDHNCEAVLLNGDIADMYQLSRFMKSPIKANFKREREAIVGFLQMLQEIFGTVYYKQGNHENRYEHYLMTNAPAIFDEDEHKLSELFTFEGSRVQFIDEAQLVTFGKLAIIHGHELKGGGTVNIARNKMLKSYSNLAFGHHHTVGESTAKDIYGDYMAAWSIGCLCNMKPRYMPFNQWMHGFATVERTENDGFRFINKKIINGNVI